MENGNFDSHIATLERVDNQKLFDQVITLAGRRLKERVERPEEGNNNLRAYRLDDGTIGCSTERFEKQGVASFYDFKIEPATTEANVSDDHDEALSIRENQYTISWIATNFLVDDIDAPYGTVTAAEYKIGDRNRRLTKKHTERLLAGDWQGETFSLGRHAGDYLSIIESNLEEDELVELAKLRASYADVSDRDSADHTMIRTVLQQLELD